MNNDYKYTHNYYSVNEDLVPLDKLNGSGAVTRGHPYKLLKRYSRTATRHNFFSFRVVDMWNKLPESVVCAPSLNSFKNRIDKCWARHLYSTTLNFPLPTEDLSLEN